jgi:adenosylcobinamide-GDP ribazoletransferase
VSSRLWHGLAGAVAFLTIVPVPVSASVATLDGAAVWFPLVGAGAGALAGAVRLLCGSLVGASVASVLAMLALVLVTGALHEDGLADTADALGARGSTGAADLRARRLQVMRDPATGVFGVLALLAWALLLVSTLASLDGAHALRALAFACALARWAALVHAAATPPARADGLGAALHVGRATLAAASALVLVGAYALGGVVAGAIALGAGALVAALSVVFARRMFGGRTGDTLGATAAVTEVAVCVALLAAWKG